MSGMEAYERYTRQMDITGWGKEVQDKLSQSRVCIVGVGGLGSPVSLYLAAAGVGTIVLCDYQDVELSNLNRQILYSSDDIGSSKVKQARKRLVQLNPNITVEAFEALIDDGNAASLFDGADIIIDCLDSFEARFMLNRYSAKNGVPFVHAGITEFYGQLALLNPPHTPCLQCFISPEATKKGAPPPVLGATAGVLGSFQAVMALKALSGVFKTGDSLFYLIDLLNMSFEQVNLQKNPNCPVCG